MVTSHNFPSLRISSMTGMATKARSFCVNTAHSTKSEEQSLSSRVNSDRPPKSSSPVDVSVRL